jgi:hypothetical protein
MSHAVEFLKQNGPTSLVSLGCGTGLNRIDNHVRLFLALNLKHYVGVDCACSVAVDADQLFTDEAAMQSLLEWYGHSRDTFLSVFKLFPGTWAEELMGIHCAVVVCQRVLPFVHWENLVLSMNPELILQEDLHGCELQILQDPRYKKNPAAIKHYGLRPFRPWRILPGERNLILWQLQGRRSAISC